MQSSSAQPGFYTHPDPQGRTSKQVHELPIGASTLRTILGIRAIMTTQNSSCRELYNQELLGTNEIIQSVNVLQAWQLSVIWSQNPRGGRREMMCFPDSWPPTFIRVPPHICPQNKPTVLKNQTTHVTCLCPEQYIISWFGLFVDIIVFIQSKVAMMSLDYDLKWPHHTCGKSLTEIWLCGAWL